MNMSAVITKKVSSEETHDHGVFAGKTYLRDGEEDAALLDTKFAHLLSSGVFGT